MPKTELPAPVLEGGMSVVEAIQGRRSRRHFRPDAITLEQLAQLLWCAQGVTGKGGRKRAAPSAGAAYPVELYVAAGAGCVQGLAAGVYHYIPQEHAVERVSGADIRPAIASAALGQDFLEAAPISILMAADYDRTARRYGDRAVRYVDMEAGHIGQNIYLQAEALGLGTVAVGAFRDDEMAAAFGLSDGMRAVYIMPVGAHTES